MVEGMGYTPESAAIEARDKHRVVDYARKAELDDLADANKRLIGRVNAMEDDLAEARMDVIAMRQKVDMLEQAITEHDRRIGRIEYDVIVMEDAGKETWERVNSQAV